MRTVILLKYGELALKGLNRSRYEKALMNNISAATRIPRNKIVSRRGRMYIRFEEGSTSSSPEVQDALQNLKYVLGLVGFSPAYEMKSDSTLEEIGETCLKVIPNIESATFKIDSRRSHKAFPHNSKEINERLGGVILKNKPNWKVKLKNPDIAIYVEARSEGVYVFTNLMEKRAHGGLPVGTSGRALTLLSGGIDSPVAGWMMQKRGVLTDCVYFHSYPYTGNKVKEKVIDLATKLVKWKQQDLKLFIPYFTKIQAEINKTCPEPLWTILHRRFMMRIAEEIALMKIKENNKRYQALITGDNLGQVASQTIYNIGVIDQATELPIFRPLLGMDKQEIVSIATEIDTFDISKQPHADCCTVFASRRPQTQGRISEAVEAEKLLNIEELIEESIQKMEIIKIEYNS